MSSRAGHVTMETVFGQTLALWLGSGDEHHPPESGATGLNVKRNLYLYLTWGVGRHGASDSSILLHRLNMREGKPPKMAWEQSLLIYSSLILPGNFMICSNRTPSKPRQHTDSSYYLLCPESSRSSWSICHHICSEIPKQGWHNIYINKRKHFLLIRESSLNIFIFSLPIRITSKYHRFSVM